ncbi:hypothetical protein ABBQ32_011522 [Trebouxia sp. C0010 RCD-2024]
MLKFVFNVSTGEPDVHALSIQSVINSALAGPQHGAAAQANADLLLSCLQDKPSPAQELAKALHALLGLPIPPASTPREPNNGRIATRGAATAVLLVQRLLQTVVQHPSQVLDWRSPDLDSVACHLANAGSAMPPSGTSDAAHSTHPSSQAESRQLGTDGATADKANADTASLAAQVAAAPLDASEQTAAAQQTAVNRISSGLVNMDLQSDAADHGVHDLDSCALLLGALISGKGNVSLLSDQAVDQVLSSFQATLHAAGSHPDTLKFAILMLPAQGKLGSSCLLALQALDLCLFSEALTAMTTVRQLRNQLLSLVYRVSWSVTRPIKLAEGYLRVPWHPDACGRSDSSSDETSEDNEVAAATGDAPHEQSSEEQVAHAASKVWAHGMRAQALLRTASVEDRASLELELQAALVPFITKACSNEPQEMLWQLQLASLIKEAVEVITPGRFNSPISSPSAILNAVLDPLSTRPDQQASRTLLAAGLCQVMGFQPVLLRDTPRAMVCVALLCAAQTSAPLHDTAQHLLGFLIDGPMPGDSLAHPDAPDTGLKLSTLLADILSALSTAARASTTFPDTTGDDIFQTSKAAACLQSLVQLLEWAAKAATTECKPVLSQWFRSTIADASEPYPSSVLLELLPVVVPALRSSEELLIDSGLPELTQQLMHRSDQLPPLAVMCQTPDPETLTSILQTLDTICACFPCPSTPLVRPSSAEQHTTAVERRFEAVATAAEKQALLAVTLRQMRGERTVAMAAAAARRATEGREAETSTATTSGQATGSAEEAGIQADASVAQLLFCTVTYCWRDISVHDWSAILKRVSTSVSQAAVLVEDLTEDVAAVATQGASLVSRGRQGVDVTPQVAIELLWRLRHMGLSDRTEGAQDAQQKMTQLLTDEEGLDRLGGAPRASLQTLAVMLAPTGQGQHASALQEAATQDTWQSGTRDALRMLLACGAIEAITSATGSGPHTSFAEWQMCTLPLWCAVSAIAMSAASESSLQAVRASVQEADAWGQETGVDAAGTLMALLLDPYPQGRPLQQAALALLLTRPLLPSVTAASTRADEEQPEVPPAKTDAVTALIRAGIRPQLAAAICTPPLDPDLVSEPVLQTFLLAWAVLLAHILGMPAGEPGKAFLAQALRDEYEVVPDLLMTILPLLPLERSGAGRKDRAGNSTSGRNAPLQRWDIVQALRRLGVPNDAASTCKLAEAVYRGVLHALPASARAWFGDLRDRGLSASIEAFTAEHESPLLLQHEIQLVQSAPAAPDMRNFSLKANSITREVVAVMEIEDGAVLEMVIKLPTSSPLRRAEVACRRRVGVTEGKLRKWLLSVTAFLANQNGSVAEAIALWQRNVQKEFEGVEECLICYSIVSASDGKLPRMHCKTCSKRFHGTCLYKWFQSSGKSNCPHCQSPW